MVHNGIEYADMQLIAEAYHLLRYLGHFQNDGIAQVSVLLFLVLIT